MTTPDERKRAVDRLLAAPIGTNALASDLRLLLSERAELLAAVERMRELLETVRDYVSDTVEGHIEQTPTLTAMAREDLARIDAALTTGEATTPNAGERG